MPRLLKDEQPHHVAAFERYLAMGTGRSYTRLAEEIDTSITTVKLWGRSFGWQERVQRRDLAEARRIADHTSASATMNHHRRRKILELAVMKMAKAIAEDRVKYQAGDLERLLKLEDVLAQLEGQFVPASTAGPEEIVEFLNRIGTHTLLEVRALFQRQWQKMYPELTGPGALGDADPDPEECTPIAVLDAAKGVRGV